MSETKPKNKKRLRGFAAILGKRLEPVNDSEDFKEFSKDISVKLL